jgi:hypothetical protein
MIAQYTELSHYEYYLHSFSLILIFLLHYLLSFYLPISPSFIHFKFIYFFLLFIHSFIHSIFIPSRLFIFVLVNIFVLFFSVSHIFVSQSFLFSFHLPSFLCDSPYLLVHLHCPVIGMDGPLPSLQVEQR